MNKSCISLKALIIIISAHSLFVACQKVPQITLTTPVSIDMPVNGSSGNFSFTANRDWTISYSESWIHVNPLSGEKSRKDPVTVTVRCDANTTYDDRTATITIRAEDAVQTVTIKQPQNLGIILPNQAFDLGTSEARTIDVEVQANVEYKVEISADWIKQTGTKALTSRTLTFSIAENTTYDAREGKITIKSQNSSVADQVITVRQAQKDAIIVEKNSYDMPYGGGEIEIKVQANVDFDVRTTVDWLHYVSTKALSTSTVRIKVDENKTYSSREGKITIRSQDSSVSDQVITVRQAQKDALIVKSANYSAPYSGGNIEIEVETNVDFDVNTNADWLHYVSTKALNTSIVQLKADENKTYVLRDANVEIKQKNGPLSCTVTVNQAALHAPKGAVDLGIEITRNDGSKYRLFWRDCNLGASNPEGNGNYFAWGEVEPRSYSLNYSWATYKWANGASNKLTKYCPTDKPDYWDGSGSPDGKTVLDPEDDVAHVMLGGKWRMPTKKEQDALQTQCTWTWTTLNGRTGYEVKSKVNSNSIFLPAVVYRSGPNPSVIYVTTHGYWSSSLDTDNPGLAYGVLLSSSGVYGYNDDRCSVFSVRPVTE